MSTPNKKPRLHLTSGQEKMHYSADGRLNQRVHAAPAPGPFLPQFSSDGSIITYLSSRAIPAGSHAGFHSAVQPYPIPPLNLPLERVDTPTRNHQLRYPPMDVKHTAIPSLESYETDHRLHYQDARRDQRDREAFQHAQQPPHVGNTNRTAGGSKVFLPQTTVHVSTSASTTQAHKYAQLKAPHASTSVPDSIDRTMAPPPGKPWSSFAQRFIEGESLCKWEGPCNAVFEHEANSDLMEHLRNHHRVHISINYTNRCLWGGCPSNTEYQGSGLAKHIRSVHLDVGRLSCEICEKSFKSGSPFRNHLAKDHPEVTWY
ncbi:hypothetical protein BDZ97DRAFT_1914394 [Flammula alnicola]|nr:hypothetical protein BDZ97DRAFT_1914394 [Flammula alnicola]